MYNNRRYFYIGVTGCLMMNYILLLIFRQNEYVIPWLTHILNLLPSIVTTIILFMVVRRANERIRAFWSCIALSHLFYAGSLLMNGLDYIYPLINNLPIAWSDILWLTGNGITGIALILLSYRSLKGLSQFQFWLDTSIFMLTIITLSWMSIIEPVWHQGMETGNWITAVVNLSYPITDLWLIFMLSLLMFSRIKGSQEGVELLLLFALLIFAAGDLIYLYLNEIGQYRVGSLIDPLWSISLLLSALAGIQSLQPARSAEPTTFDRLYTSIPQWVWLKRFLPYVSLGTLFTIMLNHIPEVNMIILCCVFGGMLILVRQILSTAENDRLLRRITTHLQLSDYAAKHDELTGLPNRRMFHMELQQTIDEAAEKHQLAIVFLDFDRFKYVNDSLGHAVGDQMLQIAAQRFRSRLPDNVLLARLGGDEFIVLISPLEDQQQIHQIVGTINCCLGEPMQIDQHSLYISPSIGIAIYPQDGLSMDELVKNADAAMYEAKKTGQDKTVFYSHSISNQYNNRLELENYLRDALQNNELSLYYQFQLNLQTQEIEGMEALLRWHHPVLGFVSPVEFIPIAEETGEIAAIGEWVVRTACMQQQIWKNAGFGDFRMSVNVSPYQFRDPHLMDRILRIVQETGIEPGQLVLEITESVAIHDSDEVIRQLDVLRAAGIQLAIDDFGSGYASLKYLKQFRPHVLKIDRSFVSCIGDEMQDCHMAEAIIALAKALNIHVLAEGVETEIQMDFLRQAGCDEIQGYYVNRPAPQCEITAQFIDNKNSLKYKLYS